MGRVGAPTTTEPTGLQGGLPNLVLPLATGTRPLISTGVRPAPSWFDATPVAGGVTLEATKPIDFAKLLIGKDTALLAHDEVLEPAALGARFVQEVSLLSGGLLQQGADAPVKSPAELAGLLAADARYQQSATLVGAEPGDIVFFGTKDSPYQRAYLFAGLGPDGQPRFIGAPRPDGDLHVGELGAPAGLSVTVVFHDTGAQAQLPAEEPVPEQGQPQPTGGSDPSSSGGGGGGGYGGSPVVDGGAPGGGAPIESGSSFSPVSDAIVQGVLEALMASNEGFVDAMAQDPEFAAWCKAHGKDPKSKDAKVAFAKAKLAQLDKTAGGKLDLEALAKKLESDPEGAQAELEALAKSAPSEKVTFPELADGSGGVTLAQLRAIMPNLPADKAAAYLPLLNAAMKKFGITTPLRQAAFLAQVAHESVQLRFFAEIGGANTRYAPYYGRGAIQLTWESNYRAASMALFGDDRLVRNPSLAERPDIAFMTAAWFFQSRGLNQLADQRNFGEITRRVNGVNHHKADGYYARALQVLLGANA